MPYLTDGLVQESLQMLNMAQFIQYLRTYSILYMHILHRFHTYVMWLTIDLYILVEKMLSYKANSESIIIFMFTLYHCCPKTLYLHIL